YGLAEATLMVTGAQKGNTPVIQTVMNSGLEQNKVIISSEKSNDTRTLVSCGQMIPGQQVKIVNLETMTVCASDQVGEIWISGPSVANGYWNKPLETALTFEARLRGSDEGPFLRTGDLGFLYDGELYITGRLKNLIISNGKNYYSHDLERTVEKSHPSVRLVGCAVFSVNDGEAERIIVIAEIERNVIVNEEEVIKAIRSAIAIDHDLHVTDIRLTSPGYIPRTTSGKIRHFLCKTNYMSEAINETRLI
ncbi:MAG: AMP-binding protein, partial [Chitinophagaceae bacterium]